MNLLLDTNALVWVVRGSKDLGKQAQRLYKEANTVYFTSISLFELRIKQASQKITLADNFVEVLPSKGLKELTPRAHEASEILRFQPLIKHDPFDRMILAQAAANHLSLLTSDQKLLDLGFDWVIDARD